VALEENAFSRPDSPKLQLPGTLSSYPGRRALITLNPEDQMFLQLRVPQRNRPSSFATFDAQMLANTLAAKFTPCKEGHPEVTDNALVFALSQYGQYATLT
jgi:hypothetical protein